MHKGAKPRYVKELYRLRVNFGTHCVTNPIVNLFRRQTIGFVCEKRRKRHGSLSLVDEKLRKIHGSVSFVCIKRRSLGFGALQA